MNFVKDSVVADPDAIATGPAELLHTKWARIIG